MDVQKFRYDFTHKTVSVLQIPHKSPVQGNVGECNSPSSHDR